MKLVEWQLISISDSRVHSTSPLGLGAVFFQRAFEKVNHPMPWSILEYLSMISSRFEGVRPVSLTILRTNSNQVPHLEGSIPRNLPNSGFDAPKWSNCWLGVELGSSYDPRF